MNVQNVVNELTENHSVESIEEIQKSLLEYLVDQEKQKLLLFCKELLEYFNLDKIEIYDESCGFDNEFRISVGNNINVFIDIHTGSYEEKFIKLKESLKHIYVFFGDVSEWNNYECIFTIEKD